MAEHSEVVLYSMMSVHVAVGVMMSVGGSVMSSRDPKCGLVGLGTLSENVTGVPSIATE